MSLPSKFTKDRRRIGLDPVITILPLKKKQRGLLYGLRQRKKGLMIQSQRTLLALAHTMSKQCNLFITISHQQALQAKLKELWIREKAQSASSIQARKSKK